MHADPVAGREDDGPLDDVAQLADVARPVVRLERGHRLLATASGVGIRRSAAKRARKWLTSSGMSSRRSRSGGMRTGTTLSR